MKAAAVVPVLFFGLAQLAAQDMMQRPGPGPERTRLSFLVGTFTTETHMPPSPMNPEEVVGRGTSTLAYGVDSMFVLLDEQGDNPVLGKYKAHGVLGYNPTNRKYTLSMYNNAGDAPQYTGTFSGDTLVLMSKIEYPGGAFDQKLYWFQDGKNVRVMVYNDTGKGLLLVVDQKYMPASPGGGK